MGLGMSRKSTREVKHDLKQFYVSEGDTPAFINQEPEYESSQGRKMHPVWTRVVGCPGEVSSITPLSLSFSFHWLLQKRGGNIWWIFFRGFVSRELKFHYLSRERLKNGTASDTKTPLKLQIIRTPTTKLYISCEDFWH